MPGPASQAPPGPTCETGEGSAPRPAGATNHERETGRSRRKREIRTTDRREKAARVRVLRNNSVQDLAPPPPPLWRHQPRRRRKRSQNTRTPRHQRKSAAAIVQGTAAECRNIAQLLL
ncbi:hypothetical protein STEG23_019139 [Scotinomys teguina]